MPTRADSCVAKHAKWAMAIIVVMLGIVVSVTVAMTNGLRASMDGLAVKVQVIEVEAATRAANQKAMLEALRRIERILDERYGRTHASPDGGKP